LFQALIHLRMSASNSGHAAVRGSAQRAGGQLSEPPLDQVDPSRARGREAQVEAQAAQQPFPYFGALRVT
jgi:hypothetical protein